jgi:hypothetical protein
LIGKGSDRGRARRFERIKMISGESITRACDAIDGLTDEQFKREFDRFLDTQSVLTHFFEQAVPNEHQMLDFVVYSSFIVWKCYEADDPGKAITVGWQHLEPAVDDMKGWWSRLQDDYDHLDSKEMEPLLRHILLELHALSQDVSELRSKEKDRVIKVMKAIMFAIERAGEDPSI